MEKKNREHLLFLIKNYNKKKEEFFQYLENHTNITRKEMLLEISKNILKNNDLLEKIGFSEKEISKELENFKHPPLSDDIINDFMEKIKKDKSKKVLYLKKFLELFQEINENDKAVLLQSLEKEEDLNKLCIKMKSLFNSFPISR
ncbi:MAG: hypothetical protein ACTSU4_02195 [Promethearchaeota archaeon]